MYLDAIPFGWDHESTSWACWRDNIWYTSPHWTNQIPTPHSQKFPMHCQHHVCAGYCSTQQESTQVLTVHVDLLCQGNPAYPAGSPNLLCQLGRQPSQGRVGDFVAVFQPLWWAITSFRQGHMGRSDKATQDGMLWANQILLGSLGLRRLMSFSM
jgi:hypothetical protein